MLSQLRKKHIIITTALLALLLFSFAGITLYSTRNSLRSIAERALDRGLTSRFEEPSPGSAPGGGNANVDDAGAGRVAVASLLVNDAGYVLNSNASVAFFDPDQIDHVIGHVLDGLTEGRSFDLLDEHLMWKSIEYPDSIRIAIVDVTDLDMALIEQIVSTIVTALVALLALFIIAWRLSVWALAPVERSWEQQRQFMADASHELKTPLAVMLANLHILKGEPGLSDECMRWIDGTENEAKRMQDLVQQMLELSRMQNDSTKRTFEMQEGIDLGDIVERIALQFDPIAFERGVELVTSIEPHVLVTGNPVGLEHLASILVDNACKYATPGTNIQVAVGNDLTGASLLISNRGSTISPEELEHIFDRFWRSDESRSRNGEGGFGLGLSIAKGIVDLHGGTIDVTSDDGLIVFLVHLPQATQPMIPHLRLADEAA